VNPPRETVGRKEGASGLLYPPSRGIDPTRQQIPVEDLRRDHGCHPDVIEKVQETPGSTTISPNRDRAAMRSAIRSSHGSSSIPTRPADSRNALQSAKEHIH